VVPKMHDDEVETDAALVRRLLAGQFPAWAALPSPRCLGRNRQRPLPAGLRHGGATAAHSLGRRRRGPGAALVGAPGPHLPVPIPTPLGQGVPGEGYPWPWSVYRWLPGDNPVVGHIADAGGLARDLAGFVAALHRIDPSDGPLGRRGEPLADRHDRTTASLDALVGVIDTDTAAVIWRQARDTPIWPGQGVWIHGDLSPGNVLLVEGRLAGVIDFGGIGLGDPAADMSAAWNLLPREARPVFRRTLAVDDDTWARGRGWALSVAVNQIPYYRDTNPSLMANSRYVINEVLHDYATAG